MPQKLITITEAAERLSLRPGTLRRWVGLRKIEYIKAGRSVRICEEEIGRIVREGTVRREKEISPEWLREGTQRQSDATHSDAEGGQP
jgi:excisionase family DNA binding protein